MRKGGHRHNDHEKLEAYCQYPQDPYFRGDGRPRDLCGEMLSCGNNGRAHFRLIEASCHANRRDDTWPLACIPYSGADYGEVAAIAREVDHGDDGVFHNAWMRAAERIARDAGETLARGQRAMAAARWQKASVFYATAYHPMYGTPAIRAGMPRRIAARTRETDAFDRAMALRDTPAQKRDIPPGDTVLRGYPIRSASHPGDTRPQLILNNGYDATMADIYYMAAVSARACGLGNGDPRRDRCRRDAATYRCAIIGAFRAQVIGFGVDPAEMRWGEVDGRAARCGVAAARRPFGVRCRCRRPRKTR